MLTVGFYPYLCLLIKTNYEKFSKFRSFYLKRKKSNQNEYLPQMLNLLIRYCTGVPQKMSFSVYTFYGHIDGTFLYDDVIFLYPRGRCTVI